ncbi:MAG: diguanylate cyclase [Vicinamibacterales bacterium]
MRLVGRNDLMLLAGLTVALFVIFVEPVARLIEYAREIEQARGLQLLPGLVILTGVYIFYQLRKRHEIRALALAAEADAHQARARESETARLVEFGRALALTRSQDEDSIRSAVTEHLPRLAPGRSGWVMLRMDGIWQPLVTLGDVRLADLERAARRAVLGEVGVVGAGAAADACFPMIAGGAPLGVLGVASQPPLTEHQHGILTTASALLGAAVKNAQLFKEIHENSVRDALTGCSNRKHALEVIDVELRRAWRSQQPLSLIMFDLDHFKRINDEYGHLCGDAVLSAVGQRMTAVLRGSDLKCRYGGEEFLILLPDTPLAGAQRVAETLRRELEENPVRWNADVIRVTASFGIATASAGEVEVSPLIGRADAALYLAKQEGRNCVRVAEVRAAIA